MDSDSGVDGKDPASFLNVDDVNGLSSEKNVEQTKTPRLMETNMSKSCFMLICNEFVDMVSFSIYYSISISIYIHLHVNVTCLYHPTIQWSSFSFFGTKKHPGFWLDTFYILLLCFVYFMFLFPLPHLPSSP